jgi:hypothetical protein
MCSDPLPDDHHREALFANIVSSRADIPRAPRFDDEIIFKILF